MEEAGNSRIGYRGVFLVRRVVHRFIIGIKSVDTPVKNKQGISKDDNRILVSVYSCVMN